MKTVAIIAALAGVALAAPHAVTDAISPPGEKTPDGCQTSYDGKFQVVVQTLDKRSTDTTKSSPLELTLKDGSLFDSQGRTGYIASNQQFQFDGPVQSGALYTAGWSVCANGSIALGNSAIFYQCLSGTFYNLYDENTAAQCSPVYLHALSSSGSSGTHTVVCQIGDGQVQQDTCITTATATPTGPIITQIGDGQIQAPVSTTGTPAVVSTPSSAPTPVVMNPTGSAPTPSAGDNSTVPATTGSPVPTTASPAATSPVPAAGAGSVVVGGLKQEVFGLAAAVAAIAFLL